MLHESILYLEELTSGDGNRMPAIAWSNSLKTNLIGQLLHSTEGILLQSHLSAILTHSCDAHSSETVCLSLCLSLTLSTPYPSTHIHLHIHTNTYTHVYTRIH
eukprot:scpid111702/ scgid18279/ 